MDKNNIKLLRIIESNDKIIFKECLNIINVGSNNTLSLKVIQLLPSKIAKLSG